LLAWAINNSVELLGKISSSGPFPSLADIDSFLREWNRIKSVTGHSDKREELRRKGHGFNTMLNEGAPDLGVWTLELMKAIDGASKEQFAQCRGEIGLNMDAYLTQLNLYSRRVVELLDHHLASNPRLQTMKAKARWVFFYFETIPYPVMTEAVIEAYISSFNETKAAIDEVSNTVYNSLQCAHNIHSRYAHTETPLH
jgi:hypothetical protein